MYAAQIVTLPDCALRLCASWNWTDANSGLNTIPSLRLEAFCFVVILLPEIVQNESIALSLTPSISRQPKKQQNNTILLHELSFYVNEVWWRWLEFKKPYHIQHVPFCVTARLHNKVWRSLWHCLSCDCPTQSILLVDVSCCSDVNLAVLCTAWQARSFGHRQQSHFAIHSGQSFRNFQLRPQLSFCDGPLHSGTSCPANNKPLAPKLWPSSNDAMIIFIPLRTRCF